MNKEMFFKKFKTFIINESVKNNKMDLWVYYEIIKQHQNKGEIREMIYNCKDILNIRYESLTEINNKWNCTDGEIIIDIDNGITYKITLCRYGAPIVIIKKIDYHNELQLNIDEDKKEKLKNKWLNEINELRELHIQNKIKNIDKQIEQLIKEKNELLKMA